VVPGYFTLRVAPEPSVERAVKKNALSTGGGIGAHMLPRALLWDSVARFVELKPPQF
jgi:hypothetical protein